MEITTRSLWTLIHGMGFGALYLLAGSGAIALLYQRYSAGGPAVASNGRDRLPGIYLAVMAVLAWLTVLSGTYIIYPWYRAAPPNGTISLGAYPRSLLLSNPAFRQWHLIGMEWKEHVAWLVPIAITAAAVVVKRYTRDLKYYPQLRVPLYGFIVLSLFRCWDSRLLRSHARQECAR
jgi:hypothetical protein